MKTAIVSPNGMIETVETRKILLLKVLLACGILSSLLYVAANDVIAARLIPGYSRISDPISELSATYAPSRPVLVPLIILYEVLLIAFGAGVWQSAQGKRALRVTGGLIIAFGAVGLASFPFPMTQRNLGDTMHIITMGIITPLLVLITISVGAAVFGKQFRLFSILMLAVFILGSAFVVMETARVAAGEPVYWYGLAERMLFGAWLLWIAVLAAILLRRQPDQTEARR